MIVDYAKKISYFIVNPQKIPGRIGKIGIVRATRSAWHKLRLVAKGARYAVKNPKYMINLSHVQASGIASFGLADILYNNAVALHDRNGHAILQVIALLKKAFALQASPQVAIKLCELQRLANRHHDAIETLREAFQTNPNNREIWYESIIYMMRHGEEVDARDLLASILRRDPEYPLARFYNKLFIDFPIYVEKVTVSIAENPRSKLPSLSIGFSVWGKRYTFLFLEYALAALLADNNLPRVSKTHDIHITIFTTLNDANAIRSSRFYLMASEIACFHFIIYDDELMNVAQSTDNATAVHAQFGLMSTAHYVLLEVARRLAIPVVLIGADNVVNDDFLSNIVLVEQTGISAIAVAGFRLPAQQSLGVVNQRYRTSDRRVSMSGAAFSRLLSECLPEECFVDANSFSKFPLFLCWRVGDGGILIHASHLHPVMISGKYLREIKYPKIDPIDGRFLVRHSTAIDRIHIVQNTDICLFDAAENPLILSGSAGKKFDAAEVGLWLWQFSDGLRERYLASPIRYHLGAPFETQWRDAETTAAGVVKNVLEYLHDLDKQTAKASSWKI